MFQSQCLTLRDTRLWQLADVIDHVFSFYVRIQEFQQQMMEGSLSSLEQAWHNNDWHLNHIHQSHQDET